MPRSVLQTASLLRYQCSDGTFRSETRKTNRPGSLTEQLDGTPNSDIDAKTSLKLKIKNASASFVEADKDFASSSQVLVPVHQHAAR
jgi:hypothetical protein